VDDVRVRVGYNRATRSPNVVELFTPQGVALGGSQDICAGPEPTGTVLQCERLGVPADRYGTVIENPAGQYNTIEGGNAALEQEIGNTVTAGIVFTPRAFPVSPPRSTSTTSRSRTRSATWKPTTS
jgi:outer membrane receptor protein involved in Fe transport